MDSNHSRQNVKQRSDPEVGSGPISVKARAKGILVVDDTPTDSELAVETFKRASYTQPITVVSSGEAGLDYLFGTGSYTENGPQRPQFILLDLGLPSMSGREFLRRVRADRRTRAIPIVIHSTDNRVAGMLECERLGASAYVTKPIDIENFVRITTKLGL